MKRGMVGVTFCDGWLRAVEVVDDRPQRFGEVPLAPGVIEQGVVVDESALTAALKQLWQTADFSSKRVAMGLEAEAAMIRRITLPALASNQIAEAVMYDISDVLGYPTAEAVIDHAVIKQAGTNSPTEESGDADIEALAVAVRTEVIEALRRSVQAAGLRWWRAELSPAAGVALLDDMELGAGELGAVVAVGEQTTSIAIHDDIGLLFARVITTGVGESASLSLELESQLAELESLRSGRTSDPAADASVVADAPGVAVVAEGVGRTLHYYTSDVDRRLLSRLLLCGPRSHASGLIERLGESLPQTKVRHLDRVDWPIAEEPERFDIAYGVSRLLHGSDVTGRRLSLVPPAFVRRRRDRRALAMGSAVALLLGGLAVADAAQRREANHQREDVVAAAERSLDRMQDEVTSLGEVQSISAEIERRQELIRELGVGDVDVAAVFGQIAETMPVDTSIMSIGVARSEADAGSGIDGPLVPETGMATLTIEATASDLDGVGRWIDAVSKLSIIEDLWLRQVVNGDFGSNGETVALFSIDASISQAGASARPTLTDPTVAGGS